MPMEEKTPTPPASPPASPSAGSTAGDGPCPDPVSPPREDGPCPDPVSSPREDGPCPEPVSPPRGDDPAPPLPSGTISDSNNNDDNNNNNSSSGEGSSSSESSSKSSSKATSSAPSDSGWFSLWDHIQAELDLKEYDSLMDVQHERVSNFLQIPRQVEKLMIFGVFVALDAFLYLFTILPARITLTLWTIARRPFLPSDHIVRQRRAWLFPSQRCDLMKGFLILVCCLMLQSFDSAQLYHMVRGQSTIKVYVIFNMLEVFDRLCSAFGRDILDTLLSEISFYPQAWEQQPDQQWRRFGQIVQHTVIAIIYMFIHAMVLFYYLVTLNVTINSYDYSLLTLLLSNQFAEIKSNVFKRYEKENLFQICCSDIVERFQIGIMLTIITLKNWIELSSGTIQADTGFSQIALPFSFSPVPLPWSWEWQTLVVGLWTWLRYMVFDWWFDCLVLLLDCLPIPLGPFSTGVPSNPHRASQAIALFMRNLFDFRQAWAILTRVLTPALLVYCSEMLADWTKHAFITKFNQVRPEVYGRYTDILCRDLVGIDQNNPSPTRSSAAEPSSRPPANQHRIRIERSLAVGNRMGLATLPLACIVIHNSIHILRMVFQSDPSNNNGLGDELDHVTPPLDGGLASPLFYEWVGLDLHHHSYLFSPLLAVVEYGGWVLLAMMAYACLVFIKLLLGINLVQYAWNRYEGLQNRQREEEERTRTSISRAEARREWSQLQKDVSHSDEDRIKKERLSKITIDNIERYTIFKNRVP
ncbi:hypothetical protein H4R33_001071 [Dimargaris cristalligena]|nr:hypothetical protein H4R33_001071 [Dimargaris cristalligena]